MKIFKKLLRSFLMITGLLIVMQQTNGQGTPTLKIGDDAPPLEYSKWIKGDKISSFSGEKLFVMEFWATWCGPCKEVMPHLTELQAKYKDKITVIGAGVWERADEGKPYESTLPMVTSFVKNNAQRMGYSVIADNNAQTLGNKWLKAAGEMGIPSTYIVKNNKIIWIGHPGKLDSLLPVIFEGKYDMAAYKNKREKGNEAMNAMMAERNALLKPITDAMAQKDFSKVITLIDKLESEKPDYKTMLSYTRLNALLSIDQQKAIEFVKEWQKERKGTPSSVLGEVFRREDLAKETYLWVANNFAAANLPTNAIILSAMGTCYAKGGDFKNAVIWQEKAVASAKAALTDTSKVITVTEQTVIDYEKALAEYRAKL